VYPGLYQRRLEPLFLRPDRAFWAVGGGCGAAGTLLAGGSGAALWPGEKDLSTAEARARDHRAALRDACRIADRFAGAGAQAPNGERYRRLERKKLENGMPP
jgi:hypothetical protein